MNVLEERKISSICQDWNPGLSSIYHSYCIDYAIGSIDMFIAFIMSFIK